MSQLGESANPLTAMLPTLGAGEGDFAAEMPEPGVSFGEILAIEQELEVPTTAPEVSVLQMLPMDGLGQPASTVPPVPSDSLFNWNLNTVDLELENEVSVDASAVQAPVIPDANPLTAIDTFAATDEIVATNDGGNEQPVDDGSTEALDITLIAMAASTHEPMREPVAPNDFSAPVAGNLLAAAASIDEVTVRSEDVKTGATRDLASAQFNADSKQQASDASLAESFAENFSSEQDESSLLNQGDNQVTVEASANQTIDLAPSIESLINDNTLSNGNVSEYSSTTSFSATNPSPIQDSSGRFAPQSNHDVEVTKVVTDNLVQQVKLTEQGESKQLRLQLHPAELGQVILQVDWENDSLKVKLLANEMAASEILNQNRSELVAALAEEGIDFDSMEISYDRQDSEFGEQQSDDDPAGQEIDPAVFETAETSRTTAPPQHSTASIDITV